MTDFLETSSVKSARRVFTVPFVNAGKFDAVVSAVMGEENPLAAVMRDVTLESYRATVSYLDSSTGKVVGSLSVAAPSRTVYDAVIASVVSNAAMTELFGGGVVADRDVTKDAWSVRMKLLDANRETYSLLLDRASLRVSSFEDAAILARVESWADSVTDLC